MVKRVHVVFKTHFDIGFTHLAKDVIRNLGTKMLPDVLETCIGTAQLGEGRKFVWTMPSAPLTWTLQSDDALPEHKKEAERLVKEGQITWHALPFTTHTEFCGLEEYIRGLTVSADLSAEYGFYPVSAKMTDVPGHTKILPTILAGAGIRFLHLGCNPGCMPPDVPRLFWWEGPDGSRVLTFYSKGAYGSSPLPPEDWPYDTWLALMQTNDNVGPQNAGVIEEIERQVYEKAPDAKISFGTMDDFYRDIVKENLDIPVIQKDLADSWIHGVGTYPRETGKLRRKRRELSSLEKLLTAGEGFGENPVSKTALGAIDKAYAKGLLFGEHTWGLDVKTHMGAFRHYNKKEFQTAKDSDIYRLMEASWEEQRERVHSVCESVKVLQNEAGQDSGEDKLHLFLGSGIKGDNWFNIPVTDTVTLTDMRDGNTLLTQKTRDGVSAFVKNAPSFGVLEYKLNEGTERQNSFVINETDDYLVAENSFYRLTVSKKEGRVVSLVDKRMSKEWLCPTATDGLFGYRYDIFGSEDVTNYIKDYTYRFYGWLIGDLGRLEYPECEHRTFYPLFPVVEFNVEGDMLCITISKKGSEESVSEYGDTKEVVTRYYLYEHMDRLDIRVDMKGKEETSYIEAVHFVLPLNLDRHKTVVNKLGCEVDIAKDIEDGANHVLYCLEDYVDVNNGETGLMIHSPDISLVSTGGQGIYRYRKNHQNGHPTLYFNAINNQWGTNFPQWNGGDYSFSFSLCSYRCKDREKELSRAKILSSPALAAYGLNIPAVSLIDCNVPVQILTFKKARYQTEKFILRIKEFTGEKQLLNLKIRGLKNADKADLQERPIKKLSVSDNGFTDEMNAFGINTYLLEL